MTSSPELLCCLPLHCKKKATLLVYTMVVLGSHQQQILFQSILDQVYYCRSQRLDDGDLNVVGRVRVHKH